MVAERKIYEDEGVEKYVAYQVEHEHEPLMPGAAFPFVKVREAPLRCRMQGVARHYVTYVYLVAPILGSVSAFTPSVFHIGPHLNPSCQSRYLNVDTVKFKHNHTTVK